MIFIYYLMFNLGQVLSERGAVPPILGLWWANGILTLAGAFLYFIVISEASAFKTASTFTAGGPRKKTGKG